MTFITHLNQVRLRGRLQLTSNMWQCLIRSLHLRNFLFRLTRLNVQPQIASQTFACANVWQLLKTTCTRTDKDMAKGKYPCLLLTNNFLCLHLKMSHCRLLTGFWYILYSFIFGMCKFLRAYWIQSDQSREIGAGHRWHNGTSVQSLIASLTYSLLLNTLDTTK